MNGRIDVITGSMFSGKTSELISRLVGLRGEGFEVGAFKHALDKRFHVSRLSSHSGLFFEARAVGDSLALRQVVRGFEVVGVDEAQFFDSGLVSLCEELADSGVQVLVAGLDLDSEGKPFGPLPTLMALAEGVTKLWAVCYQCGGPACRSYYRGVKASQVEIGASQYEARCRTCFAKGGQNGVLAGLTS